MGRGKLLRQRHDGPQRDPAPRRERSRLRQVAGFGAVADGRLVAIVNLLAGVQPPPETMVPVELITSDQP